MKKYRIAAIQGDGIGKVVVPEGIRGNSFPGVAPTTMKPAEWTVTPGGFDRFAVFGASRKSHPLVRFPNPFRLIL